MTKNPTVQTAKIAQPTQTVGAAVENSRTVRGTIHHVQQQIGLPAQDQFGKVLKSLLTRSIIAGFCVMFTLWVGTQLCFALIEWGSICLILCKSTIYTHLWYIIVTIVTCLDSWVELPL